MKPIVDRFINTIDTWDECLKEYKYRKFILDGITKGFSIGINKENIVDERFITTDPCYIDLNYHETEAILQWLHKGVDKGYIAGPYSKDHEFPWTLHCAPIFVVPKPGFRKFRPIVHLSWKQFDHMFSINELLCEHMKTVQYVSFLEVVNLVNNAGKDAYIFLIDAQDAYYRVPISPEDFRYNGLEWGGKKWVFLSLQMGLSSSPKIYTEFADAVEWICVNKNRDLSFLNNIQMLRHYIDDFFGCRPRYEEAITLYNALFNLMKDLGIPTREDKCTPPARTAKILGWVYNTMFRRVELPNDKRLELLSMIRKLLRSRLADKKALEKLIGRLQNASQVIFPGKAFVRRLEMILYLPSLNYKSSVYLTDFIVKDLKWWEATLGNRTKCQSSFDLLLKNPSDQDNYIYTDASSLIGIGGHTRGRAFQISWKDTLLPNIVKSHDNFDIELLELLGTVIACQLWGRNFTNQAITIYNDNPGAAGAIRTKAPRLHRLDMQCLIRSLATNALKNKYYFWGIHCTKDKDPNMNLADGLSRFSPDKLFSFKENNWTNDNARALSICNQLLKHICKQPPNMNKHRDIPYERRKEFNAIIDIDKNTQLLAIDDSDKIQKFKYNILQK